MMAPDAVVKAAFPLMVRPPVCVIAPKPDTVRAPPANPRLMAFRVMLPAALNVSEDPKDPNWVTGAVIVMLPACAPVSPVVIVTETPASSMVLTSAAETVALSAVGVKVPPVKEPPLVADEPIVTSRAALAWLNARQKTTPINSKVVFMGGKRQVRPVGNTTAVGVTVFSPKVKGTRSTEAVIQAWMVEKRGFTDRKIRTGNLITGKTGRSRLFHLQHTRLDRVHGDNPRLKQVREVAFKIRKNSSPEASLIQRGVSPASKRARRSSGKLVMLSITPRAAARSSGVIVASCSGACGL